MTFYNVIEEYRSFGIQTFVNSVTPAAVEAILSKESIDELDFLSLLSPAAVPHLELMAERAGTLTRQHFGNVVQLFTPMYISNYCENVCAYCSFAKHHTISRRHLSFDEIREECERISAAGIRHILVLTGESHSLASVDYLNESIRIIKDYFSSVSIEVYPLTESGYHRLITTGVDGLTIFQECYDTAIYHRLHCGGPKEDFRFRLEAPDRAALQGIRSVTVGALMGLNTMYKEAFLTGLHAAYLQKHYPSIEVSISLPRIRPLAGYFLPPHPVSDAEFVQCLTAMRLFLTSVGITISSRESCEMRNAILPLGVTRMSAGVSTAVGGHTAAPSTAQFEIADSRTVSDMKRDLLAMGYQPVMHDWNFRFIA